MKTNHRVLSLLLSLCLLISLFAGLTLPASAAYAGTGTFSKYTEETLATGDYVLGLEDSGTLHAINNTEDTSWIRETDVTVTNSTITDPDPSVVWHFDADAGTFCNEDTGRYLYWTSGNVGCCGDTAGVHTVTQNTDEATYLVATDDGGRILRRGYSYSSSTGVTTYGYRYYATATDASNISFYALGQTPSQEYTATFSLLGTVEDTLTQTGTTITLPSTGSKVQDTNTYLFQGWTVGTYTGSKAPSTLYSAGTTYTLTTDTVFYAVYTCLNNDTWTLVQSASGLVSGDYYLLATTEDDETVGYAASAMQQNDYRQLVEINVQNQTIHTPVAGSDSEALPAALMLGGEEDAWTLYSPANGGYYSVPASGDSNRLTISAEDNDYTKATISFDEAAEAAITFTGRPDRNVIRYNSTSGQERISCYTNGQNPVYLYHNVSVINYTTERRAATTISAGIKVIIGQGTITAQQEGNSWTADETTSDANNGITFTTSEGSPVVLVTMTPKAGYYVSALSVNGSRIGKDQWTYAGNGAYTAQITLPEISTTAWINVAFLPRRSGLGITAMRAETMEEGYYVITGPVGTSYDYTAENTYLLYGSDDLTKGNLVSRKGAAVLLTDLGVTLDLNRDVHMDGLNENCLYYFTPVTDETTGDTYYSIRMVGAEEGDYYLYTGESAEASGGNMFVTKVTDPTAMPDNCLWKVTLDPDTGKAKIENKYNSRVLLFNNDVDNNQFRAYRNSVYYDTDGTFLNKTNFYETILYKATVGAFLVRFTKEGSGSGTVRAYNATNKENVASGSVQSIGSSINFTITPSDGSLLEAITINDVTYTGDELAAIITQKNSSYILTQTVTGNLEVVVSFGRIENPITVNYYVNAKLAAISTDGGTTWQNSPVSETATNKYYVDLDDGTKFKVGSNEYAYSNLTFDKAKVTINGSTVENADIAAPLAVESGSEVSVYLLTTALNLSKTVKETTAKTAYNSETNQYGGESVYGTFTNDNNMDSNGNIKQTYDVTLSMSCADVQEGEIQAKNTDIILVLDNSNSMYPPYSSYAENTRSAVSAFLDIAFAENNAANNRVALVKFDSYASAYNGSDFVSCNGTATGYTSLSDSCFLDDSSAIKDLVNNQILVQEEDTGNGATNTEGGFLMAEAVARARTDDSRPILVLFFTDGCPTVRYSGSATPVRDLTQYISATSTITTTYSGGLDTSALEFNAARAAADSLNDYIKGINENSKTYAVALLSESSEEEQKVANYLLSHSDAKKFQDVAGRSNYAYINLTNNGVTYTVTAYLENDAYWKSESNVTVTDLYLPITDTLDASADLVQIFKDIAYTVSPDVYVQGNLKDTIPASFALTADSKAALEAAGYTVTANANGTTLISRSGIELKKDLETITYQVEYQGSGYGTVYTNTSATLTYRDLTTGQTINAAFARPVAKVIPWTVNDYEEAELKEEASIDVAQNDLFSALTNAGYTVQDYQVYLTDANGVRTTYLDKIEQQNCKFDATIDSTSGTVTFSTNVAGSYTFYYQVEATVVSPLGAETTVFSRATQVDVVVPNVDLEKTAAEVTQNNDYASYVTQDDHGNVNQVYLVELRVQKDDPANAITDGVITDVIPAGFTYVRLISNTVGDVDASVANTANTLYIRNIDSPSGDSKEIVVRYLIRRTEGYKNDGSGYTNTYAKLDYVFDDNATSTTQYFPQPVAGLNPFTVDDTYIGFPGVTSTGTVLTNDLMSADPVQLRDYPVSDRTVSLVDENGAKLTSEQASETYGITLKVNDDGSIQYTIPNDPADSYTFYYVVEETVALPDGSTYAKDNSETLTSRVTTVEVLVPNVDLSKTAAVVSPDDYGLTEEKDEYGNVYQLYLLELKVAKKDASHSIENGIIIDEIPYGFTYVKAVGENADKVTQSGSTVYVTGITSNAGDSVDVMTIQFLLRRTTEAQVDKDANGDTTFTYPSQVPDGAVFTNSQATFSYRFCGDSTTNIKNFPQPVAGLNPFTINDTYESNPGDTETKNVLTNDYGLMPSTPASLDNYPVSDRTVILTDESGTAITSEEAALASGLDSVTIAADGSLTYKIPDTPTKTEYNVYYVVKETVTRPDGSTYAMGNSNTPTSRPTLVTITVTLIPQVDTTNDVDIARPGETYDVPVLENDTLPTPPDGYSKTDVKINLVDETGAPIPDDVLQKIDLNVTDPTDPDDPSTGKITYTLPEDPEDSYQIYYTVTVTFTKEDDSTKTITSTSDPTKVTLLSVTDQYIVLDFGLTTQEVALKRTADVEIATNVMSSTLTTIGLLGSDDAKNDTYGRIDNNTADGTFTFTPKVENSADFSQVLTYTYDHTLSASAYVTEAKTLSAKVYVVPANNVYYEENFATWDKDWIEDGTATTAAQNAGSDHNADVHGYDQAYAATSTYSQGVQMYTTVTSTDKEHDGYFTFTGTGFDIIGETSPNSGVLVAEVYTPEQVVNGQVPSGTTPVKRFLVDTYLDNGQENTTFYQVPVIHCADLTYGTYVVKIRAVYVSIFDHNLTATRRMVSDKTIRQALGLSEDEPLEIQTISTTQTAAATTARRSAPAAANGQYNGYVDAIRIYNPLGTVTEANKIAYTAYTAAGELNPTFANIKDSLGDASTWKYGNTSTGTLYVAGDDSTAKDGANTYSAGGIYFTDSEEELQVDDDGYVLKDGQRVTFTDGDASCEVYVKDTEVTPEGSTETSTVRGFFIVNAAGEEQQLTTAQVNSLGIVCYSSKYQAIGPENEVYLQKNQGVFFTLADPSAQVQISAKLPFGASADLRIYDFNAGQWVKFQTITSRTEMYYAIASKYISSGGEIGLRLSVDTSEGTVLALCNVKCTGSAAATSAEVFAAPTTRSILRMLAIFDDSNTLPAQPETPQSDSALTFVQKSISCTSQIESQFAVDPTALAAYSDFYVTFTQHKADGSTVTTENRDPQALGDLLVFTYATAAKELTDTVEVTLYGQKDGQWVQGSTVNWCVRDGVMGLLSSGAASEKLRTLLVDLLNYAAAAQIQFAYRTDDLANSALTEEQASWATADIIANADVWVEGEDSCFVTSSLSLSSRIEVVLVVDPGDYTKEQLKAQVAYEDRNGQTQTVTLDGSSFLSSDSYLLLPVNCLGAADHAGDLTVTLVDASSGQPVSGVYHCSVTGFVARYQQSASADETTVALCNAMLRYVQSAKAYFSAN